MRTVGRYLQTLSFYMGMINGFISATIVGISWLTAEMYRIKVRAEWDTLSLSMPGVSLDDAMVSTSQSSQLHVVYISLLTDCS